MLVSRKEELLISCCFSPFEDDEDLEEVKAKVVNCKPDIPQAKTSRSKFNSFLPTPKNVESSVPRPTRKSESSETHKRKILHRDPFSIRRKVEQSEKILEPEGTPRHPAHMERSGESHAQDMERAGTSRVLRDAWPSHSLV